MPKSIFLYDGGMYKRGVDSGRSRVPLTPEEAQLVFYDPEVPADTDNSIGTELNMQKYASELCNLEVGDELFIGVVPDAALYRGVWMMSFDAVPGLTADYDLVSVADVFAQWAGNNGDATGVPGFYADASGTINYDFADGLGNSTKDAQDLAALYQDSPSVYRNEAALQISPYVAPQPALLGQALYMRLTITAVPADQTETGCCSSCDQPNSPTLQVGAIYDRLCVDKQRVRKFCNCPERLCDEGCSQSASTPPAPTAPVPTVTAQIDSGNGDTIEVEVTFDQDVAGFDETDVAVAFAGAGVGVTALFDNIVVNSASSYSLVYNLNTGDDGGGDFTFNVPAASATGVVGGLDNVLSNDAVVNIPAV